MEHHPVDACISSDLWDFERKIVSYPTDILLFPYDAKGKRRRGEESASYKEGKPSQKKKKHTFARHLDFIPHSLAPFPKPPFPTLLHNTHPTNPTILRPEILLPRAKSTNHSIRMLIRMITTFIMASIARENPRAAREAEPAERFTIMSTPALTGKRLTDCNAEHIFFWSFPPQQGATGGLDPTGRSTDEQKFHLWDLERHFPVTGAADGYCGGATHGDDSW